MDDLRRSIQSIRNVTDEMKSDGARPVLDRLVRHGSYRLYVETRRLLEQSAPFALVPAAVIGLIALLAGLPYGAGLVLVGLGMFVFGLLQAAGASGFIGSGPHGPDRNVPRIYEHMDPSWSAAHSTEERQALMQQRRAQGASLFAKLSTASALLIGAGLAITVVAGSVG